MLLRKTVEPKSKTGEASEMCRRTQAMKGQRDGWCDLGWKAMDTVGASETGGQRRTQATKGKRDGWHDLGWRSL